MPCYFFNWSTRKKIIRCVWRIQLPSADVIHMVLGTEVLDFHLGLCHSREGVDREWRESISTSFSVNEYIGLPFIFF